MISGPKLNWALVIATYGRGAVLLHALATALRQSRPPSEIIIVDGNPDHALWADRTRKLVESQTPAIRLVHVGAERLSLTVQRNQGIGLATADVILLFDD